MSLSRRRFLTRAAQGSVVVSVGFGCPGLFSRAVYADGEGPFGREGRILVVLELAGGNDGLNTIVPYRDDLYYRARPRLGIRALVPTKLPAARPMNSTRNTVADCVDTRACGSAVSSAVSQ